MTSSRPILLAGLIALAGCGGGASDRAFELTGVEPPASRNFQEVSLRILGSGFRVHATQQLRGNARVSIEDTFRAWLGDVELHDVALVDHQTLRAVVPSGISVGSHKLRVEDPFGNVVERADAYRASDSMPAALSASLTATVSVASTGQAFELRLVVEDGSVTGASAVTPLPAIANGAGQASCTTPEAQELPALGMLTFVYSCVAQRPGALSLVAGVTALDGDTLEPIALPEMSVAITVQAPAALVTAPSLAPARVNVGQTVTLTLEVSNTGEAAAFGVVPEVIASGLGTVAALDSPSSTDLSGSSSATFTLHFQATQAGEVTFATRSLGTDANSGGSVPGQTSTSSPLLIQVPAALVASAGALPGTVSVDQTLTVSVMVSNNGGADARNVLPILIVIGPGAVTELAHPDAQDISGGGSQRFDWTYRAIAPGSVSFAIATTGTDANTLAPISAPGAFASAVIQAAAALSGIGAVSPVQVSVGQAFTVTLQVMNTGEASAVAVLPAPPQHTGSGGATLVGSPSTQTIAGGASTPFTWTYSATSAGSLTFQLGATGTDTNSSQPVSATASAGPLSIQTPASLSAALVASPSQVDSGQTVTLTLTVHNDGQAQAQNVLPGLVTVTGTSSVLTTPSVPLSIAGGASQAFIWTYAAGSAGPLSFSVGAQGTDVNSGATVATPLASSNVITVQSPPSLSGVISATPGTANIGQTVTVTLSVHNAGQSAVTALAPSGVTLGGTGAAVLLAGPTPASAPVGGGGDASFVWTYQPTGAGTLTFAGSASGTDVNTGGTVTAPTATSSAITIQTAAALHGIGAVLPAQVSVGQSFDVSLQATNSGQASAVSVAPAAPQLSGSGSAVLSGSPSTQTIAGGSSTTFTWSYVSTGAGSITFDLGAAGADANTGVAVSTTASAGPVSIQTPASLSATLVASPSQVDSGQTVTVTLTVHNNGQAQAQNVLPGAVTVTGTASVLTTPSVPLSIAGGASQVFAWTYAAGSAGALSFSVGAQGTDVNSGATVATPLAGSNTVTVQSPPSLSRTGSATPSTVNIGQTVTFKLHVHNAGQSAVTALAPSAVTLGGTGAAALLTGPTPANAPLAGGGDVDFLWTYQPTGAGTLTFTASATGTDVNTSGTLTISPVTSSAITVQTAAALAGVFSVPSRVNIGQTFAVTHTIINSGTSAANGVAPSALTVGGTSTATPVSGPTPASATIAGGGNQAFGWTYSSSTAGLLTLQGSVTGSDAVSGLSVSSSVAVSSTVTVDTPAALSATLSLPSTLLRSQSFNLTLQVSNTGSAGANTITPSAPSFSGTGSVSLTSGPSPASFTLAGGASQSFVWSYTAVSEGTVSFTASAAGTDANTAAAVSTGTVSSNAATLVEVVGVVTNPLGEGLTTAQLVRYNNQIYFGPRAGGQGLYRATPSGSTVETVGFGFFKDTTGGNTSRNATAAPFASIGAAACSGGSCGPDNEDGVGLLFADTIASTEWIGIGGSRSSSGLRYVYESTNLGTNLSASYVDVSTVLNGTTASFTAEHVFHDRLYAGFSDTATIFGGPHLIVVTQTPTAPGLDASGSNATDLNASGMPDIGGGAQPVMIDTINDFVDRLFVFNAGGCEQSTSNNPGAYFLLPLEWNGCTPTAGSYTGKNPWTTTKLAGYEPEDRAFPATAVFNGRLYVARNTKNPSTSVRGAQLYACNPTASGSATVCNAGDWSSIAFNTSGDTNLATFNDAGNYAVSLLVAAPSHLYVGFNHSTRGAQLYRSRTGVVHPSALSDFEGEAGCIAGTVGCEGIGGDGFGLSPVPTHIFSGIATTFGGVNYVYFTTGNGVAPLSVVRTIDN